MGEGEEEGGVYSFSRRLRGESGGSDGAKTAKARSALPGRMNQGGARLTRVRLG